MKRPTLQLLVFEVDKKRRRPMVPLSGSSTVASASGNNGKTKNDLSSSGIDIQMKTKTTPFLFILLCSSLESIGQRLC